MTLSPIAQGVYSCFLGAVQLALLVAHGRMLIFATVLLFSFSSLMALFFGTIKLIDRWRESDKLHKQVARELQLIRRMPLSQAKAIALSLLADETRFLVVERAALLTLLDGSGKN